MGVPRLLRGVILGSEHWYPVSALGREFEPCDYKLFLDPSTTSALSSWFYFVNLIWHYYVSVKFVMWIVKQEIENKWNLFLKVLSRCCLLPVTAIQFQQYLLKGSGCGVVARAVASNTRGPRFESSHRQLLLNIYLLLTACRKDEKEAGNGPFFNNTY